MLEKECPGTDRSPPRSCGEETRGQHSAEDAKIKGGKTPKGRMKTESTVEKLRAGCGATRSVPGSHGSGWLSNTGQQREMPPFLRNRPQLLSKTERSITY